jgi:hypothetical protein
MVEMGSGRNSNKHPQQSARTADSWLRLASFTGLAAFFLALISYNFVDIDIWHQMALIRESLSAGHLLRSDPYAYSPTLTPWIDHEWGAGAIAFFTTLWFGGRAILVVKFLMAFATGFLCVRCSQKIGTDFRLLGACAPLAIFLAHLGFFTAVRAQVYSFFFTALLLLFWQLDRGGSRRWMVAWLALFPLWVNLHGGFVVGIGLMALSCVEKLLRGENARDLLLVLAGMLLETLLTPYGPSYFGYLRRALLMARPYAPEWRPVWDLGSLWVICFGVAVAVVAYALAAAGTRKLPGILPLAATAVEATLHRKLLPLFAVAWICYAPFCLQQTAAGRWIIEFTQRRSRFAIAVWVSLACVCLAAAVRQKPWDLSVPQPMYPVGPVQYLKEQNFKGNVMVPFRLGAYVLWKLFPAVKVSLDGRYEETYPNEVMGSIFRFYEARPGWQSALDAYPTDVVLVPRDSPVASEVASSGWQEVYWDREFALYARPGRCLPEEDRSSLSFAGVFP